jgi:hypothetical protein
LIIFIKLFSKSTIASKAKKMFYGCSNELLCREIEPCMNTEFKLFGGGSIVPGKET